MSDEFFCASCSHAKPLKCKSDVTTSVGKPLCCSCVIRLKKRFDKRLQSLLKASVARSTDRLRNNLNEYMRCIEKSSRKGD